MLEKWGKLPKPLRNAIVWGGTGFALGALSPNSSSLLPHEILVPGTNITGHYTHDQISFSHGTLVFDRTSKAKWTTPDGGDGVPAGTIVTFKRKNGDVGKIEIIIGNEIYNGQVTKGPPRITIANSPTLIW